MHIDWNEIVTVRKSFGDIGYQKGKGLNIRPGRPRKDKAVTDYLDEMMLKQAIEVV